MTKEINNIKNSKTSFFSFEIAPGRQFRRIIFVSAFIFLVLGVYHFYVFYQVRFVDIKKDEHVVQAPMPMVKEKKLDYVLSEYKQKLEYQNSAINLVSPDINPGR